MIHINIMRVKLLGEAVDEEWNLGCGQNAELIYQAETEWAALGFRERTASEFKGEAREGCLALLKAQHNEAAVQTPGYAGKACNISNHQSVPW